MKTKGKGSMDNKYKAEIKLAQLWRSENDYARKGGVVIVFNNEVAGWCNELRDPQHWIAGCVAIDEESNCWVAIAGNDYDGALMWLPMREPEC